MYWKTHAAAALNFNSPPGSISAHLRMHAAPAAMPYAALNCLCDWPLTLLVPGLLPSPCRILLLLPQRLRLLAVAPVTTPPTTTTTMVVRLVA